MKAKINGCRPTSSALAHSGAALSPRSKGSIFNLTSKRQGITFVFLLVFEYIAGVSFGQSDNYGKTRNASPERNVFARVESAPKAPRATSFFNSPERVPPCDDCGADNGVLQFSSPTYTVSEGDGTLVLHVTRTSGDDGSVGVVYNPVSDTAQQPDDYTAPSGNFIWGNGDATDRTITVTIPDNNVHEPTKQFTVVLSQASGGASLGANRAATVTITDNDPGSTNADLSNLELSAGAISPDFSSSTTSYTLTVPNSTTSTTVTATLDDSNATMTINGSPGTSGAAFGPIALNPGNNNISILVTAEDGTQAQYTVVVHRVPIVTSMNDSGAGSLRQALADAADGDTITFNFATGPNAPAVATVITLTTGELIIDDNIIIDGPGANALVVERDSAAPNFRIFHVNPGHTVTIEGMTIRNGLLSGQSGGGILNDQSDLTVNDCLISDNSAEFGGGIINLENVGGTATLQVTNCTIAGNSASIAGGGISNHGEGSGNNASLIMTSCTISGNDSNFGGGVYNDGFNAGMATMSVNNSTFSANSAISSGGGIYNDGFAGVADLTVSGSTFYKNSAPSGGAIFNDGSNSGTATVDLGNTILQTGPTGGDLQSLDGTITSHGYNLSSGGGDGALTATADLINTDSMLGPLKDNGGPTLTHAPLINSPAIDQGKRDAILALYTDFDQRGATRPVNDATVANATGGDNSDIGAVEIGSFVHPLEAKSWKTHAGAGSFPIALPLTGPVGVECRSGGTAGNYQLVVDFSQTVSVADVEVTSGTGSVSDWNVAGRQVTIELTGVTNVQTLTVGIFDVDDGPNSADVGIRMGVLVGDVDDTRIVTVNDTNLTKGQALKPVTNANFRMDVNASGNITTADTNAVKSRGLSSLD